MDPSQTNPTDPPAAHPAPAPEFIKPGAGQVFTPTGTTLPPEKPVVSTAPAPVTFAPESVYGPPHPQPGQPASAVTGGAVRSRKPRFPKVALVGALGIFILLAGSAAAYFGYYVPNKPENIWKTALSRSGKGYDKLSDYAVGMAKSSNHGETYSGSAQFSGQLSLDASFQGTADGVNSQTTGSLSYSGVKATLDLRTIKSNTSTPDIYFKLDGLQGVSSLLGNSDYASAINKLNGNWYFIDHSLLDQFASSQSGGSDNLSATDLKNFLSAIGAPSNTYIFNPAPDKAAFVVKQQVGREQQDNRGTYHYKVGVDKTNLKAYNSAVCDSLKNDKIFKLLSGSDPNALDSCKDTSDIDSIKDSDTADVWIDTHTKLIHRVSFNLDSQGSKAKLDIGQDYQGGDSMPFFLDYTSSSQESSSKIHIALNLDTKANKLSVDGTFDSTGRTAAEHESGEIKFNLQSRNTNLKVEKPAGSKTFAELLDSLGLGGLVNPDAGAPAGSTGNDTTSGSGAGNAAADTERKTDIYALQGHIEAYWADNAYYPTLANINDPAWRATYFQGLDNEALKDPAGSAQKLAATPAANVYSYQATPIGCDNGANGDCTGYTLTATLSDGTTFVRQSDN